MPLPALVAYAHGQLTDAEDRALHGSLSLVGAPPRTEGPHVRSSTAHREFTDDAGRRLILDLGRIGENIRVLGLYFYKGERPSTGTVAEYRVLFRGLIEQFGLTVHKIEPPLTADEVFVPNIPPEAEDEDSLGVAWDLPFDRLDHAWMHLGLTQDAPHEVKAVKLRAFMQGRVWSAAPEQLRREAEAFLDEA